MDDKKTTENKGGLGVFLFGGIIGSVAGIILVLLNAQRSGRETRQQLGENVEQAVETVRRQVEGERIEDVLTASKAEARRMTQN